MHLSMLISFLPEESPEWREGIFKVSFWNHL